MQKDAEPIALTHQFQTVTLLERIKTTVPLKVQNILASLRKTEFMPFWQHFTCSVYERCKLQLVHYNLKAVHRRQKQSRRTFYGHHLISLGKLFTLQNPHLGENACQVFFSWADMNVTYLVLELHVLKNQQELVPGFLLNLLILSNLCWEIPLSPGLSQEV